MGPDDLIVLQKAVQQIEYRWAAGSPNDLQKCAMELVALEQDVIFDQKRASFRRIALKYLIDIRQPALRLAGLSALVAFFAGFF
jgi:hypothetical protein